jgi:uncharacterized iron-regulated membrane protein
MSSRSVLKKTVRKIHLWLGFASGLVVFVVALTGAIWSFETEISDLVYDYRKVEPLDQPHIRIERIKEISEPYLDNINSIYFSGKNRCLSVRQWTKTNGVMRNKYLYLNPYNGEILAKQLEGRSFFEWVIELHMNLLLGDIGAKVVSYSTLIFLFIIISGIYLWWPKNTKARRQRFSFQWRKGMSWKRKNYDLHSVLGFYACWVILFAVITGLAWSFQWVDKTIYFVATAGEPYKDYSEYLSRSDKNHPAKGNMDDIILQQAIQAYGKDYDNIWFYPPQNENDSYYVYVNPSPTTFYTSEAFYFDQRTGELLAVENNSTLTNGEAIRNMYYDIHVGKILGLPGQLLMFFASLLVASLPITGFCIWYGRRKKSNSNSKHTARAAYANP